MNQYTPEQIKLANEIANALSDREALPLYLSYTQRYQETFLRKLLTKVLSIPVEKIKRSRGALFTYLVGQHGNASGARY